MLPFCVLQFFSFMKKKISLARPLIDTRREEGRQREEEMQQKKIFAREKQEKRESHGAKQHSHKILPVLLQPKHDQKGLPLFLLHFLTDCAGRKREKETFFCGREKYFLAVRRSESVRRFFSVVGGCLCTGEIMRKSRVCDVLFLILCLEEPW